MADHYSTLGVNKSATPDEIKKAYRRLASQHHPDKGGDTKKFQEIQTAYDVLSNPDKRAQYDNPAPQFAEGFHQYGGMPPGFEEMLRGFGGPFGDIFGRRHQQPYKNRTLNMQTTITLEEAFNGKELIATVVLPSGKEQIVEVKIPAGIQDGTALRLAQMGDDSIPNLPRGDIHLTVNVSPHHKFQRQGDDLITDLELSCVDAMVGKIIHIETIDKKTLELVIKPGTQHGQMLAANGYGMPKMNDNRFKGRYIIVVKLHVPEALSDVQKQILREHFQ